MRLQQGYFFTTNKTKETNFFSWNFNERLRSTNDTNLAGYFSQRFFLTTNKTKETNFFLAISMNAGVQRMTQI